MLASEQAYWENSITLALKVCDVGVAFITVDKDVLKTLLIFSSKRRLYVKPDSLVIVAILLASFQEVTDKPFQSSALAGSL